MNAKQRNGLGKQCACPDPAKCKHGYHYERRVSGKIRSWALVKWLRARGDARTVTTRREAEAVARMIDAAILDGTVDQAPAAPTTDAAPTPDGPTFAEAADRFVAHLQATEIATWTNERGMLRKLARLTVADGRRLGAIPIGAITGDQIEAAYQATKAYANGTRKKYKQTIKRILAWAVGRGELKASPIGPTVAMPTQPEQPRRRRVYQADIDNLIAAAQDGRPGACTRLAALIEAAIETGARKGELLAIQYRDLKADAIQIRAEEPGARKTGKGRHVPLTPRLRAILATLPASPDGKPWDDSAYVFGNEIGEKIGDIRKAWDTCILKAHGHTPVWTRRGGSLAAASRARLAAIDLEFRDLRHEAAIRWHEAGLELNAIAQLLGHADLGLLRIYLGIQDDDAIKAFHRATTPAPAAPAGPTTAAAARIDGKLTVNGKNLRLVGGGKTL